MNSGVWGWGGDGGGISQSFGISKEDHEEFGSGNNSASGVWGWGGDGVGTSQSGGISNEDQEEGGGGTSVVFEGKVELQKKTKRK